MPRLSVIPVALAAGAGLTLAACGSGSSSLAPFIPANTPSSTPSSLFSPSASASGTPATGVLDVTQLGFHMTLQRGLGTVSYSIDSSNAGPTTDVNGSQAKFDGVVDLQSSTFDGDPTCQSSLPSPDAGIELYETSASSLQFASGPSDWKTVGKYLLGFSQPQEQSCANQTMYEAALKAMFDTVAAD